MNPVTTQVIAVHLGGAALACLTSVVVTQATGLTVSTGHISCYGPADDMECSVQLRFSGALASNAVSVSHARIKRATDDTGKDLTKAAGRTSFDYSSPQVVRGEWWQSLRLKCPASSARMIRHLEGEVDLAIPTTSNGGRFTIENFMSRPGETIRDARLDEYGIKLTYHTMESYTDFQRAHRKKYVDALEMMVEKRCFIGIYGNPTNPPRESVAIHMDDPQQKLLGFSFERADGTPIRITGTSTFPHFRCYRFDQVPPKDLKLVVFVAAPGVIRTERFSLENIWLPWDHSPGSPYADPPDLRATAELQVYKGRRTTNSMLRITFTGGPMTNAVLIGAVTLHRTTDAKGNPVRFIQPAPAKPQAHPLRLDFSPVNTLESPKTAWKWVSVGETPDMETLLGALEGEVEVFQPNSTNGGVVVFSNLLSLVGKRLALPDEEARTTKLKFAGLVDFVEQQAALTKARIVSWSVGGRVDNPTNSLRFEIENPEAYLIKLAFMSGDGRPIEPWTILYSSNGVVYNFREAPKADLRLLVYLAAPEAVRLHRFRAENALVKVIDL